MKVSAYFLLFSLISQVACASSGLFKGDSLAPITLDQALEQVRPGSVVVLGENHGFETHRQQHMEILQKLRAKGLKIAVGMEFFYYPDQPLVDLWKQGKLSEKDFLAAIKWGQPDFKYYRDQALFPILTEGAQVLALNAPRSLTSAVAKQGITGLSLEQKSLLPPAFQVGRDSYRQRFLKLMPHLPTPEAGERYFQAQSVWDDTMAWTAAEYMKKNTDQVLVIVVGEFHVQYGGGLQDRLKARGLSQITSFSQINSDGLSATELQNEMAPSVSDGPRADYLWVDIAQP